MLLGCAGDVVQLQTVTIDGNEICGRRGECGTVVRAGGSLHGGNAAVTLGVKLGMSPCDAT